MSIPVQATPAAEEVSLSPDERRLVQTLRLLRQIAPDAPEEIEQFVWTVVGRHLKWDYDDPASLELATKFMALDPFLRRESEAISAEFECALMDGLEEEY